MRVSIVIRTYNEAEHVERLMIGIGAQTLSPHEVIVVDSGSTDETVAIARGFEARVVEIDRSEFTFGRSLNRGCAAATGEICVFASAHVYPVATTWLEKLVEPLADDRVALSYGRQRGDETNKFSEHQLFAQWFPRQSTCPQPSDFCNNANCAIRRSVWETVPYDESLTGLEDIAWAKTVRGLGNWIAYVADAEVIHVHDETWREIENRYRRESMALRAIDDHARFQRRDFARLLLRNVLSDARAASSQGRLREELVSILLFRYHQLSGIYRGFNGPSEVSKELRQRFYYPGDNGRAPDRPLLAPETMIDYAALEAEARHARLQSGGNWAGTASGRERSDGEG